MSKLATGFGQGVKNMERTEEQELVHKLAMTPIPPHMHDGIVQYILTGRPTGSFLTAIFENDLKGACNRADHENQKIIFDYVFFLYNNAPSACWGSEARHQEWIRIGGLRGVYAAAAARTADAEKEKAANAAIFDAATSGWIENEAPKEKA